MKSFAGCGEGLHSVGPGGFALPWVVWPFVFCLFVKNQNCSLISQILGEKAARVPKGLKKKKCSAFLGGLSLISLPFPLFNFTPLFWVIIKP